MTKNQRLYNQLRQFVDKQKVREYDNEFFAQKSLTYKFLIPYFNKYMNLDIVKDKMTDPKAQVHLADQLYKFSVHNNKDWQKIKKETRELNKAKNIPRHIDKYFLFKDQDGNPDIPKYKEMKQATNEVSEDLPLFIE